MFTNSFPPELIAGLCGGLPGRPAAPNCEGGYPIQIEMHVESMNDPGIDVVSTLRLRIDSPPPPLPPMPPNYNPVLDPTTDPLAAIPVFGAGPMPIPDVADPAVTLRARQGDAGHRRVGRGPVRAVHGAGRRRQPVRPARAADAELVRGERRHGVRKDRHSSRTWSRSATRSGTAGRRRSRATTRRTRRASWWSSVTTVVAWRGHGATSVSGRVRDPPGS